MDIFGTDIFIDTIIDIHILWIMIMDKIIYRYNHGYNHRYINHTYDHIFSGKCTVNEMQRNLKVYYLDFACRATNLDTAKETQKPRTYINTR